MTRGSTFWLLGLALWAATTPALAQRLLQVQASPARGVLGETGSIEISVRGGGSYRAVANVGSVTPVQNGRATYTPPANRQPQVALVLVWGDGVAGAVSIPLLGRTLLPVQTEPNATVYLEAGGERYGPVTADDRGRATIPLRLAPGVHDGAIVARDRAGNETRRPADLGVPDVDRTLAVKTGDSLVAGEPGEVTVAFAAAGPQGGLLAGATVTSDELEVEGHRAGPGVLVAKVHATEHAGRQTVQGQFAGARTSITLVVAAGPPARIDLSSDPPRIPADGASKAVLRAAIVDRHGNPTGDEAPEIEVDGADVDDTSSDGAVSTATLAAQSLGDEGKVPEAAHVTAEGGGFTAELDLHWYDPERIVITVTVDPPSVVAGAPGPVTVHVVAKNARGRRPDPSLGLELDAGRLRIPSGVAFVDGEAAFSLGAPRVAGVHRITAHVGDSSGEATLEIEPAEPAGVRARFEPRRVRPGMESALHVELVDRFGNRVPGVSPVVHAVGLEIGDFREEEGEAIANVRVRRSGSTQSIVADVAAGGFSTQARLELASASPFFVGLAAGLTWNVGDLVMFPVALEIGARPPFAGRPVSCALAVRYARGSGDASIAGADISYETEHLLLELSASYRLDLGRFDPFAEIGAGLAFTGSELTPTVGAVDRRSHTEPAFEIGAGVETTLGPGRPYAVLRYSYLPLSPPLEGNATGMLLLLGYRLNL